MQATHCVTGAVKSTSIPVTRSRAFINLITLMLIIKDPMPGVPRSWLCYSGKICLDHRADPCAHDVNAANLAALSEDHPISGMELHTFIGE